MCTYMCVYIFSCYIHLMSLNWCVIGSCWAFSAVVAVEGVNQIKTKELVPLSEQELVDCNSKNNGCDGGLMQDAFEFIKQQGGITTENNYPYQAKDGTCDASKVDKNNPHHYLMNNSSLFRMCPNMSNTFFFFFRSQTRLWWSLMATKWYLKTTRML